ncbi:hypothetical protein Btru_077867 [Bulinus truncatus]|nr:hypothetical protein Btru_077867 [Bulinus truncatus]
MKVCIGNVVLPGDELDIPKATEGNKKNILGPGLTECEDTIKILKPGIVKFREPATYWIDSHQKRHTF